MSLFLSLLTGQFYEDVENGSKVHNWAQVGETGLVHKEALRVEHVGRLFVRLYNDDAGLTTLCRCLQKVDRVFCLVRPVYR